MPLQSALGRCFVSFVWAQWSGCSRDMIGQSMDSTRRLDPSDAALLAAFVLIAVLGTLQSCLLVNDGAVYLAAAWLGNAWDLFYSQHTGRLRSNLLQFGPAWLVAPGFG